jgi:hypothetical protein
MAYFEVLTQDFPEHNISKGTRERSQSEQTMIWIRFEEGTFRVEVRSIITYARLPSILINLSKNLSCFLFSWDLLKSGGYILDAIFHSDMLI